MLQLLTSIQDDGTCQITGLEGATHQVRIGEMITQALKIIHGENNVSSTKLYLEEKKQVFKMQDDSVTELTYNNLVDQHVRLPL